MQPPSGTIHATCIDLAGRGVLLSGASGAGKSDLAFRLIGAPPPAFAPRDGAAVLVSDDRVVVQARDGRLYASPPASLAGMLEVRGVGILKLPYLEQAEIALVAELVPHGDVPRMPEIPFPTREICGVSIPHLALDPFEPSAPLKLWAAVHHMG